MGPLTVRRGRVLAGSLALIAAGGCRGCGESSTETHPTTLGTPSNPVPDRSILPLLSILPGCDIDHRGAIVDMGTDMMRGRVGRILKPETLPKSMLRDGATWATIESKRTEVTFTLAEPTVVFASARIIPHSAKSVGFYLDDQPLGTLRLAKGDARVVRTETTALPIDAGAHTLSLHMSPASKDQPFADVDWVRLGVPDDLDATYGAPTLDNIVSDSAVLGKVPHRALSLRAPAFVRCPLRVPKGGVLRTSLGVFGAGNEDVEIAVRVDGSPATTLLAATLQGGDNAAWKDVEVALDPFADQLVALELRVPRGASQGRALFGDPEIVVPTVAPEPVGQAQVVVIVVLAGVDRDELPPYSKTPEPNLERFTRLADHATVFLAHRAPATTTSSVVASMLTGLPPSVHTLTDPGDALPPSVETIFDVAHDASVTTALFTTVPQSFSPFGLGRSAEKVVEISPVSGEWHSPITDASTWIESTLTAHPKGKLLVVIHSRGGHPPWTVSGKQLDSLPPADYSGNVTPRRAGEQLALFRRRKGKEIPQSDFVRTQALHEVGLAEEDHALGQLLDTLEQAGLEDKALVIVTTDMSSGMRTLFADDPPLNEDTLATPLYVMLPKHAFGGRTVTAPTEAADIAHTALASLGLPPLRRGFGQDLASIASGLPPIALQPLVAENGARYVARWGTMTLTLRPDNDPFLCDVDLDPTCAFDRRVMKPFALDALVRGFARRQAEIDKLPATATVTANIDDGTLAALHVWGSMQ